MPALASSNSIVNSSNNQPIKINQTLLDAKIAYIKNSLVELEALNTEKYTELLQSVEKISSDYSTATVSKCEWILALTHTMEFQSASSVGLINAALQIRWFMESAFLQQVYVKFIESIVCVKSFFIGQVVEALIRTLTWNFVKAALEQIHGDNATKDRIYADAETICADVHSIIQRIVHLVPTSTSILQQKMLVHVPYKRDSNFAHLWYFRHLLRITDYAPMLRESVLEAIIGRIIKVDIQLQHLQAAAESNSDSSQAQKGRDSDFMIASSDDENAGSIFTKAFSAEAGTEQQEALLDGAMSLLFPFLARKLDADGKNKPSVVFKELLHVFDKVVLPTLNYRYTQYLLFYACSLNTQVFPDMFISYLMGTMLDLSRPQVFRYRASLYLGGFVARFEHLSRESIRSTFHMLLRWALQYLEEVTSKTHRGTASVDHMSRSTPNLAFGSKRHGAPKRAASETTIVPSFARYSSFYGVAQSLMYIFLFRWKELSLAEDKKQDAQNVSRSWSFKLAIRGCAHSDNDVPEDDSYDSDTGETAACFRKDRRPNTVACSKNSIYQFYSHDIDPLRTVMISKLRPLWICKASVVQEFCRVMHELQMMYLFHHTPFHYTVGNDMSAPSFAQLDDLDNLSSLPSRRDIDAEDWFFPFEPYDLPKSAHYFESLYREYVSLTPEDVAEDSSESEALNECVYSSEPRPKTDCSASISSVNSCDSPSSSEFENGAEGPLKDLLKILVSRAS